MVFRPAVIGLIVCLVGTPALAEERAAGDRIQHIRRVELEQVPSMIALSGDASTMALASGQTLTWLDREGSTLHRSELDREIVDLDLSFDGQLLAVADGSETISVYSRSTGKGIQRVRRDDAPDFLRRDGQLNVAVYADGKTLVSSGKSRRIFVSDVATGKWQYIMFVKYQQPRLIASPTRSHVALIGQRNDWELSGQLKMYRINRGLEPLWTKWHEGDGSATCAAFSPWISIGEDNRASPASRRSRC